MMRMMMKTNLSTPRHSNKHSPSNHLHRGSLVPSCVCFFSLFSPFPIPVFQSGFLRGVDEYCKNRGVCCTHFFFFFLFLNHVHLHHCSWGGVVHENCSLWPSHCAEVFVCLIHFLISHPTKNTSVKPTAVGECIMYLLELLFLFCFVFFVFLFFSLQLHMADMMIKCSRMAKVCLF